MSERDAVQELRDRAAELERSAKAIEAARVERASAQPPEPTGTTAPAAAAAGTAAATRAPGQLPPGIMTKDEMAAHAERDRPEAGQSSSRWPRVSGTSRASSTTKD